MTVHFIAAESLKVGYLIVSAHRDQEPDGRLKPDEPFLITEVHHEYSGNVLAIRVVSSVSNSGRVYQKHERVAVRYIPIEGDDLDSIENAAKVLTRFGYKDQAKSIRSVIGSHNTPLPEDAVAAPGWGEPGPLATPQGFSLKGALAPLSQEPPPQAAPPSPFTR